MNPVQVAIISGLGESWDSQAHGLGDLKDTLNDDERYYAHRFAWTGVQRALAVIRLSEQIPVLIGHSFGGSACIDVARLYEKQVRLFLIDPVPIRAIERWFTSMIRVPENVIECVCYLRGTGIYPLAKPVKETHNRIANTTIRGTDHNSVVIPACRCIEHRLMMK